MARLAINYTHQSTYLAPVTQLIPLSRSIDSASTRAPPDHTYNPMPPSRAPPHHPLPPSLSELRLIQYWPPTKPDFEGTQTNAWSHIKYSIGGETLWKLTNGSIFKSPPKHLILCAHFLLCASTAKYVRSVGVCFPYSALSFSPHVWPLAVL